eukprot:1118945-Pyramimonas_sp.AAC.1
MSGGSFQDAIRFSSRGPRFLRSARSAVTCRSRSRSCCVQGAPGLPSGALRARAFRLGCLVR